MSDQMQVNVRSFGTDDPKGAAISKWILEPPNGLVKPKLLPKDPDEVEAFTSDPEYWFVTKLDDAGYGVPHKISISRPGDGQTVRHIIVRFAGSQAQWNKPHVRRKALEVVAALLVAEGE